MEQTTVNGQSVQPQAPYVNQEHTSTGSWFLTIFLTSIPLVNFILLLVWAFSHSTPLSKRNWARAMLIWMLVAFVLLFLMAIVGGIGMAALESGGY